MTTENSNERLPLKRIFSIAAVTFGIHVGGGFATGNQTVNFFAQYGWTAVIFPTIAMIILNLVLREELICTIINKGRNYKDFIDAAYHPFAMVFGTLYEIGYILLLLMATSAAIAGAAALLASYGLPYHIGIIVTGAVFFILTIFGKDLVAKAATTMTVIMAICVIIMVICGLTNEGADLSIMSQTNNAPLGILPAIWMMLRYAGFQAYTLAASTAFAPELKNKRNATMTAIVNFILNTVMIQSTCIMLLVWMPRLGGQELPIYYIATQTGLPWLQYLYAIVLLLAFVSTGMGCIFGFITRTEDKVLKSLDITKRRSLISLICMLASMGVSTFGLSAIVSKGYASLGVMGVIFVILPCLTIVAYRNYKNIVTRKQTVTESEEVSA